LLNKVIHGDCLEIMKDITDKSIDMILCDLPYGTTACSWDIIIPFEPLWHEYKRIIKSNGAIVLTASQPFTSKLIMSNLNWFKYEYVWEKSQATGFLNAKKRPMVSHENICVFYKNQPVYYPQITTGHKPINKYTKSAKIQNKTEIYGKVNKDISGGGETVRYPRSVLLFASDKQKNKLNKTIHPTQKPIKLFEYFIKTYTNEGDIVLDNCAGSFTTAVAAIKTNRNWICIEKEKKYCEIGKKRIESALKLINQKVNIGDIFE
jgi:site-specific DNA-methyltransferase (adenine-specific)